MFPGEATPEPVRAAVARRCERLINRARGLVRWGARFLAEGEAIDEDVIARMLVSCAEECARMGLEGESTPAAELTVAARALLDGIEWLDQPR